ncbi:receptor-type tyrosine-protein phosphatase R [Aplochiton taeniatus]
MRKERGLLTVFLFVILQLLLSESFSGDHDELHYISSTHYRLSNHRLPPTFRPHKDSYDALGPLNLHNPLARVYHPRLNTNSHDVPHKPLSPVFQPNFDSSSHDASHHPSSQQQTHLDSKSLDAPRHPLPPVYSHHLDSGAHHAQKSNHGMLAKLMPAAHIAFRKMPGGHRAVNLLAQPNHEVHLDNIPISARHIVTVYLQVDVRRLNVSLLRLFREGVAAALDIPASHVHIHQLDERNNGIELYVSTDRSGVSEPLPAEEVIRSLNVRTLHRRLGNLGITEVSSEKNVLQGQHERDHVWGRESVYVGVIFLTIFIIIITCLMVLYRLKEKVQFSDRQIKQPHLHLTPAPQPHDLVQRSEAIKVTTSSSMVQTERAPALAKPTLQQPITACRRPAPSAPVPIPIANSNQGNPTCHSIPPTSSSNELKPCPSPFRMKSAAGLQERRGSNVSLVLDMSALGSVEPLSCGVVTPRESAAQEYLQSAGRTLSRQQLRDVVHNTHTLHTEFAEIPMNFVDPKDLDIPSHGTKNRYKTILPNPHSRVVLKSKNTSDPLSSYINANYIRGYLGDKKAYIATQGPMINTVNDFWLMVWQEDCPVIVMITKLKEKNEKCVLYWPERRGIYGRVEVLVDSIRECEHYTMRTLTLKHAGQSRMVQHYWYTSWPDHKTPDSAQPLLQLMTDVEQDRQAATTTGPVVVHCSAGIGRTGCFIATTIGCRQMLLEGVVDVVGIICQLRADRGGMIQTGEQYEFVHHALSLYESRLSADTGQ